MATVWYAGHWVGREVAVEGGKLYAQMTLGELVLTRIAYVRTEEPCTIKSYVQQAVTGKVPNAGGASAALKKQGYCQ